MKRPILLALAIAATGCAGRPLVTADVETHGTLREADRAHRVRMGDVWAYYAVGALSELRGEVTVVGGKVVCSYPDGQDVRTVIGDEAAAESATMLVLTRKLGYFPYALKRTYTLAELEGAIEELAAERGIDVTRPFPFIVWHQAFPRLALHVVDGSKLRPGASHAEHREAGVVVVRERQAADLVGFHSRAHEGIFTYPGHRTHVHAVLLRADGAPELTGHLDEVVVPYGAMLLLPAP